MHPFAQLNIPSGTVGIHWFGQSSFGLKDSHGTIVQVDPYYPHDRPADMFIHAQPPLDEADLPTDFVLLTHNHGDHTCVESNNRIRAAHADVLFVGPPESANELKAAGVTDEKFTTITAGDNTSMADMTVHTVWAKPPEGVPGEGIEPPNCQHLGYVIEAGGVRVYISGDPINTFANHESLLKPVRDLKPDIGLLTTHPTEGEFPFFEGSAKTAVEIGLKTAVPAHYNCFVKRTYDPNDWARHLPVGGPKPLIIAYNQSVIYPG